MKIKKKFISNFKSSTKGYILLFGRIKKIIFKKIISNSLDYFLKAKDIISLDAQTEGIHEPEVTNLISYSSKAGFSDFLIDIGANIGLTSCQNGNEFKYVICFEPNPLCVHILKVNTEISIVNSKVEINEYGLGENPGEFELWIPKHNWGGAFVRNTDNSYPDDILASKDGFSEIKENNYLLKLIKINSASEALTEKFSKLSMLGFTSGIVKIDVEGMEEVILKGLATALPKNFKVVIIFENWNQNFDFEEVSNFFSERSTSIYKISSNRTYNKKLPRFIKAILLLLGSRRFFFESIEVPNDKTGIIVTVIE